MAETDPKNNTQGDGLFFEIGDPQTPDYYVNQAYVSVSNNDVSLCFGRQIQTSDGSLSSRPIVRVTMTHNMFLIIMNNMTMQAGALGDLYGDELPNLVDLERRHPERFEQLRKKLTDVE